MPEVSIIGAIDRVIHTPDDADAVYCRYRILTGEYWSVLNGLTSGQTQTAMVDELDSRSSILCHPIDISFSTSSIQNWPIIEITLWKQDNLKRNEICGYGSIRVPTVPGAHVIEVPLWRPKGTWYQELASSFLGGGYPHLTDNAMITDPMFHGRHHLMTISMATVIFDFQVCCSGFDEFGVVFEESEDTSVV